MKTAEQTLIGARVPKKLKEVIDGYCKKHGIKLSFFVTQAVKDKLSEVIEDENDIKCLSERLNNPEYVSQEEFNEYLLKRGVKI